MFKNYLKIVWRNLKHNKGYSAINIGGLALGMAVALIIGLWISDELSFNKQFDNYDRVAKVMQHQASLGSSFPRATNILLFQVSSADSVTVLPERIIIYAPFFSIRFLIESLI